MGSPWRMIIEPGWTGFAAEEDDEDAKKKEAEQSLPSVGNNDAVLCADVDALKKKTTPPSRFSEGSLIERWPTSTVRFRRQGQGRSKGK